MIKCLPNLAFTTVIAMKTRLRIASSWPTQRVTAKENSLTPIVVLGQQGSVFIYTDFERKSIETLLTLFPILPGRYRLSSIASLTSAKLFPNTSNHPNFRGSFSIKKVLPALVSDLSYDGLDIRDGETAITRFARMARGEVPEPEFPKIRQQLLDYCQVDTLAMVKLHEKLVEITLPKAL